MKSKTRRMVRCMKRRLSTIESSGRGEEEAEKEENDTFKVIGRRVAVSGAYDMFDGFAPNANQPRTRP